MKKLSLIIAALVVTTASWATSTPPKPTPTTNVQTVTTAITNNNPNSSSGAGASSDASAVIGNVTGGNAAGGQGGSVGPINTTGGQGGSAAGGQGGTSTSSSGAQVGDTTATSSGGASYSAAGDVISSNSSKYLSLPQPVWTTVPTAFGCLVTESKAGAIGWNFISASGTRQASDVVCATIRMSEAAMQHCHFASAAMLNKRAFEHMHPGASGEFFMLGNPQNLGPVECEDLKRPKLRIEPALAAPVVAPPSQNTTVNVAAPSCATAATAPTRKPIVRKPAKKQCVSCCKPA